MPTDGVLTSPVRAPPDGALVNTTRGIHRLPSPVPATRKTRTAPTALRQPTGNRVRAGRFVLETSACPTPRPPAGREPSGSEACRAAVRPLAGADL